MVGTEDPIRGLWCVLLWLNNCLRLELIMKLFFKRKIKLHMKWLKYPPYFVLYSNLFIKMRAKMGMGTMGVGLIWVSTYDSGRIFRPRTITTGSDPEVPRRRVQFERTESVPTASAVYRLVRRCHEGSSPAALAREVRLRYKR